MTGAACYMPHQPQGPLQAPEQSADSQCPASKCLGDEAAIAADSASDGAVLPPYHYTPKHHWAIKLNFLSGITLLPWITLLCRHWRAIDWLAYPHRLLFLSVMACVNSLLALMDWLLFSRAIAAQPLHPEPVFILGHPRTGTTHLHNLLSTDPRFAFATTFHAGFPSSFLTLEPARRLLAGLLEPRRPMDNMALHWDLPAEDEIAVNTLTGGDSPYLALVLPKLWRPLLRRYLTFGSDSGAGQPSEGVGADGPPPCTEEAESQLAAAYGRWLKSFLWFMRKVTYRNVRNRLKDVSGRCNSPATPEPPPLLIKSPVHTARLATWLRLLPRARFIYVHRHPYEVFQSASNMADTYYWYTYLQRPTDAVTNDFIMDQYDILNQSYIANRSAVPPGRLVEVSFDELDADPVAVLRRVYQTFGWMKEFEAAEPRFRTYLDSLEDFKKNHFNRLTPGVEAIVRKRWSASFTAFGYS